MWFRLVCRRFATDAPNAGRQLRLSFVSPYQALIKDTPVHQVNLSTTDGDCGVLAGHVPTIFQLKPGLVEVFEGPASSPNSGKNSFFVSGGFAIVNPDSTLQISAMEAVPVEHLDPKLVSEGLTETARRLTTSPTDEVEKAEIAIHQEVYNAMNTAISKSGNK